MDRLPTRRVRIAERQDNFHAIAGYPVSSQLVRLLASRDRRAYSFANHSVASICKIFVLVCPAKGARMPRGSGARQLALRGEGRADVGASTCIDIRKQLLLSIIMKYKCRSIGLTLSFDPTKTCAPIELLCMGSSIRQSVVKNPSSSVHMFGTTRKTGNLCGTRYAQ